MSRLLAGNPYGERDDALFLQEMADLTRHHLAGCPEYARIWPGWSGAGRAEELPYLHAGLFKRLDLRTAGVRHGRVLTSSSTSGSAPSRVALDPRSSALQAESGRAILCSYLGEEVCPLLVLDHAGSLRRRGELAARVAAALVLQPLASGVRFLLEDPDDPRPDWEAVTCVLEAHRHVRIYGLTWILWLGWGDAAIPEEVSSLLLHTRVDFVHSGGWKRLEGRGVPRERLEAALLRRAGPESRVLDYYGLAEQVGVLYPLCEAGSRHVPAWAEVLVRDPHTLKCLESGTGLLQLLNCLAYGAPYHSVLTEDLGRLLPGPCPCGRPGRRFELIGRLGGAEPRGCGGV